MVLAAAWFEEGDTDDYWGDRWQVEFLYSERQATYERLAQYRAA